jgi:IS1 family transposase
VNILSRDKQTEIIAALCEGVGQRAIARLTGTDRKTVARLALSIGRGAAELHDRMMVGLRVHRIECDELWAYVGHKRNPQDRKPSHSPVKGDQYTYVALASSTRAIIGYRTGKRTTDTTDDFIQDLRQRVIGLPEISTDGLHFYKNAIRDAFGSRVAHGVFRPREIIELLIEPSAENWTADQLATLSQDTLFEKAPTQKLEKIPFDFSYHYLCGELGCRGHTMMCTDWEMGQAYREWRQKYGDSGWEAKFRQRFETEMIEKNDTHFFVGTVHKNPASWIIVGLFYPPKQATGDLFDTDDVSF